MSLLTINILFVLFISIILAFFNGVFLMDKNAVIIDTVLINYIDSDETHSLLFKAGAGILFGTSVVMVGFMIYLLANYGIKFEYNDGEKIKNYNTNKTIDKNFIEKFIKYVVPIFILMGVGLFSTAIAMDMPKGRTDKFIWGNIGLAGISLIFILILSVRLFGKNIYKSTTPGGDICNYYISDLFNNYDQIQQIDDHNLDDSDKLEKIENYLKDNIEGDEGCTPKQISRLSKLLIERFKNFDQIKKFLDSHRIERDSEEDFRKRMESRHAESQSSLNSMDSTKGYIPKGIDKGGMITSMPNKRYG
jgi:hypothetical protein